jgi:general secretion pathway protein M
VSATSLPEGRRGRILALGILLIAILAAWIVVAAPLFAFYGARADRLAERRALASHMEQLVAQRPMLEARAATLGREGTAKVAPIAGVSGDSIPVATAALQSLVQDIASGAGASLASVESLPGETTATYRRVGVKLTLSASWPVLVRFLEALEQSATAMAADDLQIRATAQSAHADQPVFDIGLSVYASAGPVAEGQK